MTGIVGNIGSSRTFLLFFIYLLLGVLDIFSFFILLFPSPHESEGVFKTFFLLSN